MSLATLMYAQDYDETLPPGKSWHPRLRPYLATRVYRHDNKTRSVTAYANGSARAEQKTVR